MDPLDSPSFSRRARAVLGEFYALCTRRADAARSRPERDEEFLAQAAAASAFAIISVARLASSQRRHATEFGAALARSLLSLPTALLTHSRN